VAEIEYRCPAHGAVENFDRRATPRCPLTRSKKTGSGVVVEPCGLPLIASSCDGSRSTGWAPLELDPDDEVVLRAAVECGEEIFDAISLLAMPALQMWVTAHLELAQGKVQRALDRLEAAGLVECAAAAYRVSLAGHDRLTPTRRDLRLPSAHYRSSVLRVPGPGRARG
jgi:hypothetical protein